MAAAALAWSRGALAAARAPHRAMAVRFTQSSGRLSARRGEVQRRTGALAVKVGMLGTWDASGQRHALTVLHVDGCRVVQVKDAATDGYTALQLGAGALKPKHAASAHAGHCGAHGGEAVAGTPYELARTLAEFRVSADAVLPPGTRVPAAHFAPGQLVDVRGATRGKGFQGAMKRWNFGGQRATHGVSKTHRAHGSMGGCQNPGRVFKGKKMAGRMGGRNRTAQNLTVHKIDTVRDLLFVRGCVPGAKGTWVRVTDAVKKVTPAAYDAGDVPFPTRPADEDLPDVLEMAGA